MLGSLFALLYVAHLVSDYAHASVHVLVGVLALAVGALTGLDVPPWRAAVALAWIGVTHAVIDRRWLVQHWMRAARQPRFADHGGAAHVDQTAHLVVLLVAALGLSA
ncbi:DUF3307 domain-containing protein [Streptomyces sp. SPB074]|uniref:DUF3307 domain-containing protein n=1 Tax=Streptomyces sp. (strain SPB074) TaxID=465543 RepID=UPI00017F258E|nr:DUF3307 domain-containing protein [Streptomyces sp. SPB074]EDY43154.1 hypothetical protein SSBG_01116 [Streptomyces sp. SPB074]